MYIGVCLDIWRGGFHWNCPGIQVKRARIKRELFNDLFVSHAKLTPDDFQLLFKIEFDVKSLFL